MTTADQATTANPPRPPLALVVLSVIVMCVCAAIAGLVITSAFLESYPPLIFISVIAAAIKLLLGVNQFLGTFRRWPWSAFGVGLALILMGVSWVLMLLFTVTATPPSADEDSSEYVGLCVAILFGVLLLAAGIANLLWQIRLIHLTPPNVAIPLTQFSFRELWLLMTVLGVMLSSTGYLLRQIPPQWGENVEPARARFDLPEEAKRVCFSRTEGAMAVEFTLDEARFRRWVSEDHPHDDRWRAPLEPISTMYEINRCWKGNRPPAVKPIVKLNQGLYLEEKRPGRSLQVAYDSEAHRAYLYETWLVNYDH